MLEYLQSVVFLEDPIFFTKRIFSMSFTLDNIKQALLILIIFLFVACGGETSSSPAPVVNLKHTSSHSTILENGDSVDLNLILSETVDTDTAVTLSFSSSTAQSSEDFKLRYQHSNETIPIHQNNEALVMISAGKLSVKITLYSVYDCLDEGLESIKVQIKDVSNQIMLGEDISISVAIEDNTYDESFYYASTDGIAGNDGSCDQPFTLADGLYYLREAKYNHPEKTTLVLKEGVYRDINASFVLRSGTAGHPIVIRAEYPDKVFFVGQRTDAERDGSDEYGLLIQEASYVTIKDISFANYGIGIRIYDSNDTDASPTSHITIENCTMTDNGHEGIEVVRSSHVTIKNSYFMGSIPAEDSRDWEGNLCDSLCAIQDYGVAVYGSSNTDILDNIFVGRHHQVVSFKEEDTNGSVERNIFVGALYTAIYLGQNYVYDNPKSMNLTARYNIVMDAEGFPVKSPLRIDNVEGATVEYNYFEDFDYSNNLSGIFVLKRAKGTIDIKNNILAFGINNHNSGAFEVDDDDGCPSAETSINITDNIAYKVHHLLTENGCSNQAVLSNNQAYKLFVSDPSINKPNDPVEQNLSFSDYESLYQQLTQPILDYASGQ